MDPGWDDDDVEPRPPRRRPATVVVAVLVVFALVGGGIIVVFDRTDDTPRRRDARTELLPPASIGRPATPGELESAVAELSAFVADARGLPFLRPVDATLLDDEAFSARVRDQAVEDLDALRDTEDVLRALGLLDAADDLAEVLTAFLGAGVVGFYDPETGELVVRGASLTPYVRTVLVHELTHALDDQHFGLERPELDDADDETGLAFAALVEGNAVRVEELYRDTLSDEDRRAAIEEESAIGLGIDLGSIPRVVPQLIGFPYLFGPGMVAALHEAGGERRIDAAFADPPVTSEQVLDPARWLAGEAEPVVVPPPGADGAVIDEGTLGLWGLYVLLADELGDAAAVEAARGWGGDWYVAWRRDQETCVRASVVMDTAADLRDLIDGLEQWAAAHARAEVRPGEGVVTFAACG